MCSSETYTLKKKTKTGTTVVTQYTLPEGFRSRCKDIHYFHECGHRVQIEVKGEIRDNIERRKHHHWGSCRSGSLLNLNFIVDRLCTPGCPGITIPMDDLDMYHLQRKTREEQEDLRLSKEELQAVQRRRESIRDEEARSRETERRNLKIGDDVVLHERP